ncbi:MAG: hypothetical protein IJH18_03870 [Bacilli bacterium]|nr:hypothetical protein [Bacilli bacterium]
MAKKKKRKKKQVGKKEYLFNVLSILIVIIFALVIGYRSIYYYSKQTNKKEKEAFTLKSAVVEANRLTKGDNGLHKDKEGYYFTGIVDNNYVSFFNRLFRVVRIYDDNSVKLVSNSNEAVFDFGDSSNYDKSNVYKWLNKTTEEHSGIYYNTFSGVEQLLKKTNYCIPKFKDEDIKCTDSKSDYFLPLSLEDYILAGGKKSFMNTEENFYLLGINDKNDNLYVDEEGNVEDISYYNPSGIKVEFTLNSDVKVINGTGTLNDPYVIDQKKNDNYVNKYLKLDNDLYKIYENGDVLRLIKADYIKVNNEYYEGPFSNLYGTFNPFYRRNIAYFLNTTYYNGLSYKDLLEECEFYIGEVSDTTSVDYKNIYGETITNKVGLPNMYDYNSTKKLNDYFLINTISKTSKVVHVFDFRGIINNSSVDDNKKIVPTVCVRKSMIKKGIGTISNPYKMR